MKLYVKGWQWEVYKEYGAILLHHHILGIKTFLWSFQWIFRTFGELPLSVSKHDCVSFSGAKCGGCHEVQKFRVYRNRLLLWLSFIRLFMFYINSSSAIFQSLSFDYMEYMFLKRVFLTCICYFIQSFGYRDIARSQWCTIFRLFPRWGINFLETFNHYA